MIEKISIFYLPTNSNVSFHIHLLNKPAKVVNMPQTSEITDEMREAAEAEIKEKQKPVDYNTKEYPIDILIKMYSEGLDDDTNELFIPDYQREMRWSEDMQSKLIESVLLGLPIPYIFVADVTDESRLEIIDGTQRIRTLARFLNNYAKCN